jgi:hypothetical protein
VGGRQRREDYVKYGGRFSGMNVCNHKFRYELAAGKTDLYLMILIWQNI